MDVLCQAKSGMGKTAVFVLATLQQLEPVDGQVCQVYIFIAVKKTDPRSEILRPKKKIF